VSVPPHNFVYTDGDQQAAEAVQEALAPRFSVVAGRRTRTIRRTWLDTFDWRLYRAGLTLEYVARNGHGHGELVLTGATGERITAAANGTRWPALAARTAPPSSRALRHRRYPPARRQPFIPVRATNVLPGQLRGPSETLHLRGKAWHYQEPVRSQIKRPTRAPSAMASKRVRGA